MSQRAILTWVEREVPSELRAKMLYDSICVPEQHYLRSGLVRNKICHIKVMAHVWINVVDGRLVYQDLWDGMWEVP